VSHTVEIGGKRFETWERIVRRVGVHRAVVNDPGIRFVFFANRGSAERARNDFLAIGDEFVLRPSIRTRV